MSSSVYSDPGFNLASMLAMGEEERREVMHGAFERARDANPLLNAFITLLDEPRACSGPFAYIPYAVKDIVDTEGIRTTAGSRVLADNVPGEDAQVVRKLKSLGAAMVGKTNTHEFAFGPTNVNPWYGPARNPHDTERISGGSSGGSAVAVASGMSVFAIGTDTGGSVRIPAALCGVVGYKPTIGYINTGGVIPLSYSLDHVGFLTRSVQDAQILLDALLDTEGAALRLFPPDRRYTPGVEGCTLGVLEDYVEASDSHVRRAFERAVEALRASGATVRGVRLPHVDTQGLYGRIRGAEAAHFHSRYRDRSGMYSGEILAKLAPGMEERATEYVGAQMERIVLARQVDRLMDGIDAFISPTVPVEAPRIGEAGMEVHSRLNAFTHIFNLTGQPALSIPIGNGGGLPVGLQVAGRRGGDIPLLSLGISMEGAVMGKNER